MSEPLFVIGDVHGDAARLAEMLAHPESRRRRLVLVGDYVNRGPASADVLTLLSEARHDRADQIHLLIGNHELALLRYLAGGDFVAFARHGGTSTIRSYVERAKGDVRAQLDKAIPAAHRAVLNSLETFYENDELLISHAGYDPASPTDRSKAAMTTGHPEIFGADARPRPTVICGHYVQSRRVPLRDDGLICLDTGCGTVDGPLTAVLWPELEFIST